MARPRKHGYPADKPASLDAVIAAQVKTLRLGRGWSQPRLAKALGVSGTVAQQLETGARRISAEELCRLAYALDVSPAELLAASFTDMKRVPLFGGKRFPRRDVRAWAAGEQGAALPGMDERRYDEQVSDEDYLARKRVVGIEELEATVHELHRAAAAGNEEQIDDCLRALEAQVRHVRQTFGRKRGTAIAGSSGSGTVEVIRGSNGGENDAP